MTIEKRNLEGVFTALATPFKDGEICWRSLGRLVRHQLDGQIDGLVIGGTTAESPTLSAIEKKKLFDFVRSEVAGAVPLVMGTGSNNTRESVAATQAAKSSGAAAALVVVPYYNKPSQRGLYEHYKMIAEEGGLPVWLYNVPSRTITKLELETIQSLAKVPGIIAIKEASGDVEFGRQIAKTTDLLLSSGDDGTCLALVAAGGRGVISVLSNLLPGPMVQLMKRACSGDALAEGEFARAYGELNSAMYSEANPIPLKYALSKAGIIDSPELRLPLTTLDEKYRAGLDRLLQKAGVL